MINRITLSVLIIALSLTVFAQGGFIENKGQINIEKEKVLFKKETPNYNLYLTNKGLMFHFHKTEEKDKSEYTAEENEAYKLGNYASIRKKTFFYRADISLLDADLSHPIMIGEKEMKRNFYLANCPDGILDVKSFTKIIFKDAYPNIDFIVYEAEGNKLKYDFVINPGADVNEIKIKYSGFDDYKLSETKKTISLTTKLGELKDSGLNAFYEDNIKEKIPISFSLKGDIMSFNIKNIDVNKTLIIDPVLTWSTFYNDGSSYTQYTNPKFDNTGSMYNVGYTSSSVFPVLNAGGGQWFDGTMDGFNELVIVKFNPNGSQAFATYYGGANYEYLPVDYGSNINVDSVGNLYIVGHTRGSNPVSFPTYNPGGGAFYQDDSYIYGFGDNAFILKFNSNGVREWATIFQHQQANTSTGGIILTGIYPYRGKIYFTGHSSRSNGNDIPLTPLSGAYNNSTFVGSQDVFVGRFSSTYALEWCTYMNNGDATRNDFTYGGDLTGDKNGNLYLTARSSSAHNLFASYTPTKNLTVNPGGGAYYQSTNSGGWGDVYLARFNTSLNVTWATYFGGANGDVPSAITTDTNGNVYGVMRGTGSYDIPTVNPGGGAYYQSSPNSSSSSNTHYREGFIFKFTPTGSLNWATYFGGSGANCENYLGGIEIDKKNQIYISGFVNNLVTFPTLNQAGSYYDATLGGNADLFYGKFNQNGVQEWTTLVGGSDNDNSLYNRTSLFDDGPCGTQLTTFAGTLSTNFPLVNPGGGALYQSASTTSNFTDVIVSFYHAGTSVIDTNTTSTTAICETGTKTLTATLGTGAWSIVSGGGTITGNTYTPANITSNTLVTVRYTDVCGNISDRDFTVEPTITPAITSSNGDMCIGEKRLLTGTPTGGVWSITGGTGSGTIGVGDSLLANTSGTIQLRYRITNACGNNDATQTITVSSSISVAITSSTSSLCADQTRVLTGAPTGGVWNILNGPATESGGVLTPNGIGTAQIEYAVTNSCGSGADTIDVIINPLPNANAGLDENICAGDTVTLTATGGGTYQWTPGPAGASNQVYPGVTTGYRVDVTSDSGCIASDSVTVFVQSTGTATAQDDQGSSATGVQETIDVYTNDIGGINTIQILSGPSHGTATVSNGNVLYTSTAGYIGNDTLVYEICDANCGVVCDTAIVVIVVENDLTIPIGISPNGDGKNDVFNILGLSRYPNNSIQIYNRWGSLIYEAQPYLNDWNGQSKKGEVIEGTYFYILKLGDDLPSYNGYIELKK